MALRTNPTIRELAAVFVGSASHPRGDHAEARNAGDRTRRSRSTLIVDRHYRYSCNAQVLIRARDLKVVAVTAGGPGHRNDPALPRVNSRDAVAHIGASLPTPDI